MCAAAHSKTMANALTEPGSGPGRDDFLIRSAQVLVLKHSKSFVLGRGFERLNTGPIQCLRRDLCFIFHPLRYMNRVELDSKCSEFP